MEKLNVNEIPTLALEGLNEATESEVKSRILKAVKSLTGEEVVSQSHASIWRLKNHDNRWDDRCVLSCRGYGIVAYLVIPLTQRETEYSFVVRPPDGLTEFFHECYYEKELSLRECLARILVKYNLSKEELGACAHIAGIYAATLENKANPKTLM